MRFNKKLAVAFAGILFIGLSFNKNLFADEKDYSVTDLGVTIDTSSVEDETKPIFFTSDEGTTIGEIDFEWGNEEVDQNGNILSQTPINQNTGNGQIAPFKTGVSARKVSMLPGAHYLNIGFKVNNFLNINYQYHFTLGTDNSQVKGAYDVHRRHVLQSGQNSYVHRTSFDCAHNKWDFMPPVSIGDSQTKKFYKNHDGNIDFNAGCGIDASRDLNISFGGGDDGGVQVGWTVHNDSHYTVNLYGLIWQEHARAVTHAVMKVSM